MQLQILPAVTTRACPGILHEYAEDLIAFEYTYGTHRKPHTLVFIGGLGDGLSTVKYVTDLVLALQGTEWSIFAPILSSSYNGWGTAGLGRDIDQIAECVRYVRGYKEPIYGLGKIVLMGHSTGCQDIMHYLSSPNPRSRELRMECDNEVEPGAHPSHITRPALDGAIIQAPVSDREAMLWEISTGTERDSPAVMREMYLKAVADAERAPYEDQESDLGFPSIRRDTLVPLSVTARMGYPATTIISSRRFLSLASPDSPQNPSEDDIFSSDLSDESISKTFGNVRAQELLKRNAQIMVLYSGNDQSVPPWVDKNKLLRRWRAAMGNETWHPDSMVIPGASHSLSDCDQEGPRRILCEKVLRFLNGVERMR